MVDNDRTKPADDRERPDLEQESDDRSADSLEIYDVLSAEEPRIGDVEVSPDESAEVADRWFFAPGGRARQGPVSFSALKQKAASRELARQDLVCSMTSPPASARNRPVCHRRRPRISPGSSRHFQLGPVLPTACGCVATWPPGWRALPW